MYPGEYTFILSSTDGREYIKYKRVNIEVGAKNFFFDLKRKFGVDIWVSFGDDAKKLSKSFNKR